jgi:cytidylate kinase
MRPRIHIIGGPGGGKSFAAAALSARFDVPAYDLDDLFWASPYRVRAAAAERDRRLADLVARDGWIIEGAYHDWLAPSFDAAHVIIELIPSFPLRQWRVTRRFGLRKLGFGPRRGSTSPPVGGSSYRAGRWSMCCRRHLVQSGNRPEGGPQCLKKFVGS